MMPAIAPLIAKEINIEKNAVYIAIFLPSSITASFCFENFFISAFSFANALTVRMLDIASSEI